MSEGNSEKEVVNHNIEYIKGLIYIQKPRHLIIDEIEKVIEVVSYNKSAQVYMLWKISVYLQSRGKSLTQAAISLNKAKKAIFMDDDKTEELEILSQVEELKHIDLWVNSLIEKRNKDKMITEDIKNTKEVFITYSWDSEEHKQKALSLMNHLREEGFEASIDRKVSQEETSADFMKMMHSAMTDYKKVIVILSKGYKEKANKFKGGVGAEYSLIIKDINQNPRKYILVSFEDVKSDIMPLGFADREVVDLSNSENEPTLFRKLQDIDELKISPVAAKKPTIQPKEIPKFKFKEQLNGKKELEEINREPTVHFHYRLTEAFPGIRGVQWFTGEVALSALKRFFKAPLIYKSSECRGIVGDPIWWFRGSSAEGLRRFQDMGDGKILINSFELRIDKIAIYNGGSYWNNVLYIQTKADEPTPICELTAKEIGDRKNRRGYAVDYFGYNEGMYIKPEQAEDGAGIINDEYVKFNNPEIRERFLTPYNYILVAKFSPANSPKGNKLGSSFMNDILKGEKTFEEFVNEYDRLPRHFMD